MSVPGTSSHGCCMTIYIRGGIIGYFVFLAAQSKMLVLHYFFELVLDKKKGFLARSSFDLFPLLVKRHSKFVIRTNCPLF